MYLPQELLFIVVLLTLYQLKCKGTKKAFWLINLWGSLHPSHIHNVKCP